MSHTAVPVVAVGLGPIGARICGRLLARTSDATVVAGVDIDPVKLGRTLGDVVGDPHASELVVVAEAPAAPEGGGVAIQATSSSLELSVPQAMQLARLGWNVLSTSEEMAFPRSIDPALAHELDVVARHAGVTVLGAGVNPGYIMDVVPLTLTALCTRVEAISVRRVVDTNQRREQLQRKAGVGMRREDFEKLAAEHQIGHVGLRQSVQLLASRLGWELSGFEVSLEPMITGEQVDTGLGTVPAGGVIGQHQVAIGYVASKEAIRLDLIMAAGYPPVDEVFIKGDPPIHQLIEGGLNGDIGTEAVIANLVRPVFDAHPGLLTMADLVPAACEATRSPA